MTRLGGICSDKGNPEITHINDCKEAKVWIDANLFIDHTSSPDPKFPRGCYRACYMGNCAVGWNPLQAINLEYPEISTICLNSGKFILV